MVTSEEEITHRLEERDVARGVRRAQAATTVGGLARRHTELAGQLASLERELGEILMRAGDVIDVPELAQVTDIPAAELTRWRDQTAKLARGGKRKRPSATTSDTNRQPTTRPRAARPAALVELEAAGPAGIAAGAAGS
ncbi:hypothetical protein [Amycolatopsis sp. PS_44_ISF1]|uniref:hypothetical protein n=1 Tax=Amycolatopsis sp. PS_44_ISF1 TaxID=2974917 RepID=UPI0028DEE01E|nr:hypothetical protein [Amycolatopsis sp. PS_44_ISF1]MDT8916044.1 hypothetical protein [Amycolatopsis sp. PS_44_ISF1]